MPCIINEFINLFQSPGSLKRNLPVPSAGPTVPVAMTTPTVPVTRGSNGMI